MLFNNIMKDLEQIFFELIRVSIGTQESLSRPLKGVEWKELYGMAKMHSLVGVCFAGVRRLKVNAEAANSDVDGTGNVDCYSRIGMKEMAYVKWMGMAAKIQRTNEKVNRQCVEMQKMLAEEGFKSSVLKGQGVGSLYGDLSLYRQSGDIDIWVEGGMTRTLAFARKKYGDVSYDYINAHLPVYEDTEVELHWRAQALTNIFSNMRLQKWLRKNEEELFLGKARLEVSGQRLEIVTPSVQFNAFYILLHCYHHMFESGLGLRQLMDYFFVLKAVGREGKENKEWVKMAISDFGLNRFAGAVMWILATVFDGQSQVRGEMLEVRDWMICEVNEKEGRFLLNEVMQNGNFGQHDKRIKKIGNGKLSELWRNAQHNWHLISHYPSEFFWQPIWMVYHFVWKRILKH